MKRFLAPFLLVSALLLLPACKRGNNGNPNTSSSSAAASSEEIRETRNVTYRGTVEPLGATIYMQGTHALALGDGRMLILESADVDLGVYVGQEVEVFGALRPTVEAGGIIMRVERITDLSPEPSSSSSLSSLVSPTTEVSSVSSTVSSKASVAPAPSSSRVSPPLSSLRSSAPVASTAGIPVSAELEARIVLMAKEDVTSSRWTQQYCTDHIGFCVPIHKNWWFVSFGNTTQTLWHVEVNTESFEGMGSGPISINLVGGELSGHSDGAVVVSGGTVTGYRSWTQGRHFRITADARLEAAVRYMTENLRATE